MRRQWRSLSPFRRKIREYHACNPDPERPPRELCLDGNDEDPKIVDRDKRLDQGWRAARRSSRMTDSEAREYLHHRTGSWEGGW